MRNCIKTTVVLAAMAIATPSAMALPYADLNTVGGYGPYQTGQGGEFTLHITTAQTGSGIVAGVGANSTWSYYAPETRDKVAGALKQPSFQTFCVEGSEHIYTDRQVDVTLADSTKNENHPLTVGAAWLYQQFATAKLDDYNYTGTDAQRKVTADQLQKTLWWLMGTNNYTQALINAPSNPFSTLVQTTFTGTTMFDANAGQFNVSVLRLWADGDIGTESYGNRMQDQLVMTGIAKRYQTPDGGFTAALLGLSLAGLAALRRVGASRPS